MKVINGFRSTAVLGKNCQSLGVQSLHSEIEASNFRAPRRFITTIYKTCIAYVFKLSWLHHHKNKLDIFHIKLSS